MNMTIQQIKELQAKGKIRGFTNQTPQVVISAGRGSGKTTSAAKEWLAWNLPYWCNDHLVTLETEYKFDLHRNFRFDFAIPALKIAIEYEGIFKKDKSRTGHTSVAGVMRDIEKYNLAQSLGWRLIRVTAANYKTVLLQLNAYVA